MRRAQQQTITFAAEDSTLSTGARKSGLSILASDVKISKDGGAFASATNAPTEIGSTGRYALVLTATEMNCGWIHIYVEKTGMRPWDREGETDPQATFAVVADGSNSATSFVTNLTSAITDAHKGKFVRFQTGTLAGQLRKVTAYNGTTKALSFADGFSAAPTAADVGTFLDD
jgi:hypothetical protein